jgi:hypothetical protein
MVSSFNFHQKPLSPLVLKTRTCSKNAYATTSHLVGTVVRAKYEHSLHSLILRTNGTLVTILFGPRTTCATATAAASPLARSALATGSSPMPHRTHNAPWSTPPST